MTANLLAPRAVPDKEWCEAKLEQRKQRQAQYYNRGAIDLDPLKRGDTVRLKPFQLGKREWQKGKGLDERSYKVETPYNVVRRNRVHLRFRNEPSPPSIDSIPYEISAEVPEVPASSLHSRASRRQVLLEKLVYPCRVKKVRLRVAQKFPRLQRRHHPSQCLDDQCVSDVLQNTLMTLFWHEAITVRTLRPLARYHRAQLLSLSIHAYSYCVFIG